MTQGKTIGMIGLGNMGTATAKLLAENGHEVLGWDKRAEVVAAVNRDHQNPASLPDQPLPPNLRASDDLAAVVAKATLLISAVHVRHFPTTLKPIRHQVSTGVPWINLAKGIDPESGLTACQTLKSLFPDHSIAALSGPSIANEFSRGAATAVMLARGEQAGLAELAALFQQTHFQVHLSDDPLGVELGGILKNAYAIGLGFSTQAGITAINSRAAYLTGALAEMKALGTALGARAESFEGLAGMGDLLATSLSEHSHNRHLGQRLAEGHSLAEIEQEMGSLPEGYQNLHWMQARAKEHHVAMPLLDAIAALLDGELDAAGFSRALIERG